MIFLCIRRFVDHRKVLVVSAKNRRDAHKKISRKIGAPEFEVRDLPSYMLEDRNRDIIQDDDFIVECDIDASLREFKIKK